ncbi:ATP synthase epsilon chain [uncultured Desulfatiglans sp.]|nr:ATP synthase epsilon chain [uncultured Desulfatiglans sp.]
MGDLFLEVVTPEKVQVSQKVDMVVAPGSLGEFGVLEGHVPFLTGLIPGALRYTAGGKPHLLAVSSGFVEVSENKVTVLVDSAERAEEIDLERARLAMERAKERLSKERGRKDIDFMRAELSLRKAIARIKVGEATKGK